MYRLVASCASSPSRVAIDVPAIQAFILYEYLLTINAERKVIWGRDWTIAKVLYLLNRSLLLLFALAIFLWGFGVDRCGVLNQNPHLPVFSGLRVHAINRYNWFWTILVVLLGCVSIPPNMVLCLQNSQFDHAEVCGCSHDMHMVIDIRAVAIAAATCSIMRDVVVIGITWYRTAGIAWEARKVNLNTSR
ncbi:hypothetical protein BD413DRAFT_645293 [Trametes elegans]|nr:hypothetical protein BD413DRAFT_645293 [Trametes elegans]